MLEFQLSTFIFQIINFSILLAVLSWFLFRPLLRVMRKREEDIAARLSNADERAKRANEERQQLQEELQKARIQADTMITQARSEASRASEQILDHARHEVLQMTEEARRRINEQERVAQQRLQSRLSQTAVTLAGNLIREAVGPTLHDALVERLIEDEVDLEAEHIDLLHQALSRNHHEIVVEVAYPPSDELAVRFRNSLARTLANNNGGVTVNFRLEPSLIAGVRILVGTVAIDLSLSRTLDELVTKSATQSG